MGNDHEYALVGGINRASVGRWLALAASAISGVLVFLLLSAFDLATSIGIDANVPPVAFSLLGAGTVYAALYIFFSRLAWRWPKISRAIKVPDLAGEWECRGESSYSSVEDSAPSTWVAVVRISQNWDKICVSMTGEKSRSESVSAALVAEGNGEFRLLYHYRNDPRRFEDGLSGHHGFVDLVVAADCQSANGVYFTGRGRTTFGTMQLQRVVK